MPLWDGPPPPRVPRNQKEAGKASGVRTDPQHRGLAAKKFNESVNLDATSTGMRSSKRNCAGGGGGGGGYLPAANRRRIGGK